MEKLKIKWIFKCEIGPMGIYKLEWFVEKVFFESEMKQRRS